MPNNIKNAYAMINGVRVPATYDEAGDFWAIDTTAPSESSWGQADHTYHVTLHGEDMAGNTVSMDASDEQYGDQLKIRVLEKTKPIARVISPTESAVLGDSTQTITFEVADTGGSGLNMTSVALKINGTLIGLSDITFSEGSPVRGSYTVSGLSDGANKVELSVTDNDGNVSDPSIVNFVISTVAPLLMVTTPAEGLITNDPSVRVTGKAKAGSELTSLTEVTVGGLVADLGQPLEDGYIPFSLTTVLTEGSNSLVIVAKDSVGKTTSITRSVTLDTVNPIITDVHTVATTVDANGAIRITFRIIDQ